MAKKNAKKIVKSANKKKAVKKTVKKAAKASSNKKAVKKIIKKVVKKNAKSSSIKKVVKKIVKKAAKKITSKVGKKTAVKPAKKVAAKIVKKTAPKTVKKAVKKTAPKTKNSIVKKNTPKKAAKKTIVKKEASIIKPKSATKRFTGLTLKADIEKIIAEKATVSIEKKTQTPSIVESKTVPINKTKEGVKIKNEAQKLSDAVVNGILEVKGRNISLLDLTGIQNRVCDYFIICQADSTTQVNAIADSVIETVKKETGERPYRSEGFENSEWILVDYVNVVVHIFQSHIREFYNLESLWADAEETKIAFE